MGLLPGGAFIVEGFNYYAKVKQERLNLFLEKFKEYLESWSGSEIPEDFQGLFESIIKKVAETKSESKRETFRKILINSIEAKKVSDFSETFLNLTSALHEKQIEILEEFKTLYAKLIVINQEISKLNKEVEMYNKVLEKQFSDGPLLNKQVLLAKIGEKHQESSGLIAVVNHEFFGIQKKELNFYLQDLESKCLMQDIRGHGMTSSPSLDYIVTEFGLAYLEFLKL